MASLRRFTPLFDSDHLHIQRKTNYTLAEVISVYTMAISNGTNILYPYATPTESQRQGSDDQRHLPRSPQPLTENPRGPPQHVATIDAKPAARKTFEPRTNASIYVCSTLCKLNPGCGKTYFDCTPCDTTAFIHHSLPGHKDHAKFVASNPGITFPPAAGGGGGRSGR